MIELHRWPCYLCRWATNETVELLEHLRDNHGKRNISGVTETVKKSLKKMEELRAKGEEIPPILYLKSSWPKRVAPELEKSDEVYRANLRTKLCREGIVLHWGNARTERPTLVWNKSRATIGANTDGNPFIIYQYREGWKESQSREPEGLVKQFAETIAEAREISEQFILSQIEFDLRGEPAQMPLVEILGFPFVEKLWINRR